MKHILMLAIVMGAASLSGPALAQGAGDDARWQALKGVSHQATFAYRIRGNKDCLYGHIQRVSEDSLSILSDKKAKTVIPRADLERVWDGQERNDFIYTIHSSWTDVIALNVSMNAAESIRVIDRRGTQREGRVVRISDSDITLKTAKGEVTIAKSDAAIVEYIRLKPVSDDAQVDSHRGLYIRPELWAYKIGIPPKMTIRVYDSRLPETLQPPGNCSWHD